MKRVLPLLILCLLASCAGQRIPQSGESHRTAEIRRTTLTLTADGKQIASGATLQAVIDSVTVISVQPIAGIEAFHLKATPDSLFLADRLHRQRMRLTFADINRYVRPRLTYKDLEGMVTGHWGKNGKTERTYKAGRHAATISMPAATIRFDENLRLRESRSEKYEEVDWKTLINFLKQ